MSTGLFISQKFGCLLATASTAALLTSGPVLAQSNDEQKTLETVTVSGSYAGSLDRSLDLKRNSEVIADAVVASDIGKLPAVNVAEALQRVPGVTIVREAGEGQFISVRGLGPNFQAVTLNGMPMAYNENIRTSGQSGRQFRLRILPADLIGGVVVNKTSAADMIEGGIGSNVDIRLVDPLDRNTSISASVFGSYEERTEALTPNGAVSASWKTADDTFGVIGGISFSQREVQFDRLQKGGWRTEDVTGFGEIRAPGDTRYTVEEEDRDRLSIVGGLQWKPSDNLEIDADLLFSQFNNEIAERRITYQMSNYSNTLVPDTAVVDNGRLIAGTIDTRIRNTTEFSDQAHENLIFIAGAKYDKFGWSFEPKLSLSEATSDLDTPLQRIEYRNSFGDGQLSFNFGTDPVGSAEIVTLQSNLDLTDPSTIPFRRYRIRAMNSKDEDMTLALNASRELEAVFGGIEFTDFKTGIQYSDRSRDYQRRDRSSTTLRPGFSLTDDFNGLLAPANAFDQSVQNRESFTSANFDLWRAAYVIDGEFDGVEPSASDLTPTAGDLRNSYGVEEEIISVFGRLDFESEISGTPFTGNLGLRYVTTDSTVNGTIATAESDGAGSVTTVTTPATFENSYEELLPSLSVNFELNDNMMLRFGVSKTMTRPSLSELRSSINTNSSTLSEIFDRGSDALSDPTINLTGSGGNPNLAPYASWNFDASYEWYFDTFGAFSAGAFYKDVSNYIASDIEIQSIPFAVNDGSTLAVDIAVSSPANVGDVEIYGLELGYTNKLDIGLGVSATATFAESDLELDLEGVGIQTAGIQGISDTSFSITPFYEKGPFEANISYTWRDDFLTDSGVSVTSRPVAEDTSQTFQKGFGTLDAGASFHYNENLEFFVQGTNLTEERPVTYTDSEDFLHQIHTYGRTVNFGVRGQF